MRSFRHVNWTFSGSACALVLAIFAVLTTVILAGCSGGGSGDSAADTVGLFNTRNNNLYQEAPAIEVQGNKTSGPAGEIRTFNPKTPLTAELYDSDGDNIPDTKINQFESYANAANQLLDFDLAACIKKVEKTEGLYVKEKHLGYEESSQVWVEDDLLPDTMPPTADAVGTNGTQFLQLILPFEVKDDCLFVKKTIVIDGYEFFSYQDRRRLDHINPYYLTFTTEDWDGNLRTVEEVVRDFEEIDANPYWDTTEKTAQKDAVHAAWEAQLQNLIDSHVHCTLLVDGVDRFGDGPNGDQDYDNWNEVASAGANVSPGVSKSSAIFIAQATPSQFGVPNNQAFSAWSTNREIHIHLKQVVDTRNKDIFVDSKWFVLREGSDPVAPVVWRIEATDLVLDADGYTTLDWDDPAERTPDDPETVPDEGDPKTVPLVHRTTNFLVHFSKPVIPETVGQSIVFKGAPFNGNISPVATSYSSIIPSPNPCAENGLYRDPLAPNISIQSTLYYPDGTSTYVRGIIPFRVHPLHQNNLCTYVLNPVIDLPGSDDLGTPPLGDDQGDYTRMRMTVRVHMHDENTLTGRPTEVIANPTAPPAYINYPPVNMGVTGFFGQMGETMEVETEQVFTVTTGGRYVNAPVSPHALYFTMGNKGLGVIDLDGNGFTTNDPDTDKAALVTSQNYYSKYGNAAQGNGNKPSYGARAVIDGTPGGSTIAYIGLGSETSMPGVNEGSSGIDEPVRDSLGNIQLYPDPTGKERFYNITDVEIGDFLDTVYFDIGNEWVGKSLHLSAINQVAEGAWANNLISTPPTPNPPPLSIPIGMRPTHVILDTFNILTEGAFVLMGKEVFTVDLNSLGLTKAVHTGFIHLNPAELAGTPTDETFPPKPDSWVGAVVNPFTGAILASIPGQAVDFMNTGPIAESSTIGFGWYYGSRQQIGNFLFVADKANNHVRVLNSNTMDVITTLSGLSAPDSLAVTPDLTNLYVSNSGGQSVTIYNVDPRTEDFLSPITDILVGSQPKGICCQPENESVFVCNYGSSTISIINPKTNTVRKTISSLLKNPWDMVVGPRQINFGFGTQVFHGYISNTGGDNVLIFESGPSGFGGVGYDDILDPVPQVGENGQVFLPIQSPRGICWDPSAGGQYTLTGGCYVGHRSGSYGVVSRIVFSAQQGAYGPIFLIPNAGAIGGTPGFGKRQFLITAQWGGVDNPLSGTGVSDVALLDYNRHSWLNDAWQSSSQTGNLNYYVTNLGDLWGPQTFLPMNNKNPIRIVLGSYVQTYNPDRLYVSFLNHPLIDVVDLNSGQILKTITDLPSGVRLMKTYFKN